MSLSPTRENISNRLILFRHNVEKRIGYYEAKLAIKHSWYWFLAFYLDEDRMEQKLLELKKLLEEMDNLKLNILFSTTEPIPQARTPQALEQKAGELCRSQFRTHLRELLENKMLSLGPDGFFSRAELVLAGRDSTTKKLLQCADQLLADIQRWITEEGTDAWIRSQQIAAPES